MDLIVYFIAAVIVLAVLIFLLIKGRKQDEATAARPRAAPVPVRRREDAPAAQARRRRTVRDRMQRTADESTDEEDLDLDKFTADGKIGAKKLKKLQEKEEKKRMREAELEEREARKEHEKQKHADQRKIEAAREAKEAAEEAEEKKRLEEKEKQEYEEYLKLKSEFTVEEEGTDAIVNSEEGESLLDQFIGYIKEMKVIMLEDLASHFNIKTQDVIDRIQTLKKDRKLSGVLDDRGKFIYITKEEYLAVAKFIKQRGRVSISELAEHSNKLINLNPDNASVHRRLLRAE